MPPNERSGVAGPRIVAELGRPETPDETAVRTAEASRLRRTRQTVSNLLLSLAASLAVVFVLVLVVVRPDQPARESVDYGTTAAEAQGSVDEPLIVPALPDTWSSNSARLESGADGITAWHIGFITPEGEFLSLTQGIEANASWLADRTGNSPVTTTVDIDGVTWSVSDNRTEPDAGNLEYVMTTIAGASTVVLSGTASETEFMTMATAIAADLMEISE